MFALTKIFEWLWQPDSAAHRRLSMNTTDLSTGATPSRNTSIEFIDSTIGGSASVQVGHTYIYNQPRNSRNFPVGPKFIIFLVCAVTAVAIENCLQSRRNRALTCAEQAASADLRQEANGKVHTIKGFETSVTPNYKLGFHRGGLPLLDNDTFVGRQTELAQLHEWLPHAPSKQSIVVISGLGGIGKTHLSIHFAEQCHNRYSSIIWLNAKTESTLKTGLVDLATHIQSGDGGKSVANKPDEDQAVQYVQKWLSEPENEEWLVIYDNYDDPRLPGIKSSTGYDIRQFFPYRAQGSILITTRSSRIGFGKQVRLCKLDDIQQSLTILANRSGRVTEEDADAYSLAKQLDGLPLALSTAGMYIRHTASSFGDYLQMYKDSWNDLAQNSDELLEYEDRTLYTTWNLSLNQVKAQDPEAAQLLQLMAYLSNLDLWYELFQKGAESGPTWLSNVVKSKARFNKAMGKLQEYSLVEVKAQVGRYSLHPCVHDWTLEYLNHKIDPELYHIAVSCIARNVKMDTEAEFWVVNFRLVQHVSRLESGRLQKAIDWSSVEADDLFLIAYLNDSTGRLAEAEAMYRRALDGGKKAWGPEHTSTLNTAHNLGNIYKTQGKLAEAEAMYNRALDGKEKAWGPEHPSTLDTVCSLGNLYTDQGKVAEAEAMFKQVLNGMEKVWGPKHISTLETVNYLGICYKTQGELAEAEAIFKQVLNGMEKVWGPKHISTLETVNNLGIFYAAQDKVAEAEAMFKRALDGFEKELGLDHQRTMRVKKNLQLLNDNKNK